MPFDSMPLSPAQEDALVEEALHAASCETRRTTAVTLDHVPPAEAIERGWQRIVERYPALTASIAWRGDGTPRQVLGAGYGGPHATVLRAQTAGDRTTVALEYHPVVVDDAAARLLLGDVVAEAAGIAAPVRPSIDAYLAWLDAADTDSAFRFWQDHLAAVDGPTLLASVADGAAVMPVRTRCTLPASLAARLDDAADDLGVSVAALVFAAWARAVSGFRGERTSVVGALIDRRPAGMMGAIGSFEGVLPVVVSVDRRVAPAWARAVSATLDLAHAHAHVSRSRLRACTGGTPVASHFDTAVDLRGAEPAAATRLGGLAALLSFGSDELVLEADPSRVDADLARALVDACAAVLDALCAASAGAPVPVAAELPMLPASAAASVVAQNATATDRGWDTCLHRVFEAQVRATPDAPAITCGDVTLTYAELNRRANRLAHRLIETGVRPDDIVGLCSYPGIAMNVGILAILKAGAAYAPLDPAFPAERLEYLSGDLACDVVLMEPGLSAPLPANTAVVELTDGADLAAWQDDDPVVGVDGGNLAYVMYTSGSTGRPKGVLIQHAGSVNFVRWMATTYELRVGDASLQWTAYGFDAAVWELFWPLFVGARAVIAPAKLYLDLDAFTALIRRERVATLHFVPAMLQTFLTSARVGECTSLRHVFVSGEPVPTTLVAGFQEALPAASLHNLYGVTEVSIDSTVYTCPPASEMAFVRSGRPISNTSTFVLGDDFAPLPHLARGEVFIGGASVTRGYLGRPSLTAQRFVPDPFGPPGSRLYRTGDQARLLPDGHLQFLGRDDHQVKIRGIRVELLEVQAEVEAHPDVRECLVVPFGDGNERSLAAYVVLNAEVGVDELRAFLGQALPDYMVPTAIVVMPAMPLNSNGKIDRKLLPPPSVSLATRVAEGRPPRTPLEREVADIWSSLLGLEAVGIDDDFFTLGGNSLLATRVIGTVRERFGVDLPLKAWLESNSVAQLAAAIDRWRRELVAAKSVLDALDHDVVAAD